MSFGLKSQIAPKGLHFNPSDFIISDKYATILTVVSYPKYIMPGYLATLTNMSGIKVVVKHIPVPFQQMSKMLNKQIADLKEKYNNERDQTERERIRQDAESLEYFTSMLARSQARIFDFQLHIMITADTKEELELKKLNVKNYLDSMELRAVALRFEQEKVLKSIIPVFDATDVGRIVAGCGVEGEGQRVLAFRHLLRLHAVHVVLVVPSAAGDGERSVGHHAAALALQTQVNGDVVHARVEPDGGEVEVDVLLVLQGVDQLVAVVHPLHAIVGEVLMGVVAGDDALLQVEGILVEGLLGEPPRKGRVRKDRGTEGGGGVPPLGDLERQIPGVQFGLLEGGLADFLPRRAAFAVVVVVLGRRSERSHRLRAGSV